MFASYEDGTSRSTAFQTTLDGQPPDKWTRKTCTWRHAAKRSSFLSSRVTWLKALANSRGSYLLAGMETSNNTLDQVHSVFVKQTCRASVDSINSTCTYFNTVNKRILITANKRIHIISAYFLAATSDKRMRLLTSLYGIVISLWMSTPWSTTDPEMVVSTCTRH